MRIEPGVEPTGQPWYVESLRGNGPRGLLCRVVTDQYYIADVAVVGDGGDEDEGHANAALISAAKELRGACVLFNALADMVREERVTDAELRSRLLEVDHHFNRPALRKAAGGGA